MIFSNSFWKSGTNLTLKFLARLFPHNVESRFLHNYNGNAEKRLAKLKNNLTNPRGIYTTHCPYDPIIEQWLDKEKIPYVFVLRHPLDVAISFVHYSLSVDTIKLHHVLKRSKDPLLTMIQGHGNQDIITHTDIPNIVKAARSFEGWMNTNAWVLRYEDLVTKNIKDVPLWVKGEIIPALESALKTRPHTWRKGVAGEWKHECKPHHIEAFYELGGEQLLKDWDYYETS